MRLSSGFGKRACAYRYHSGQEQRNSSQGVLNLHMSAYLVRFLYGHVKKQGSTRYVTIGMETRGRYQVHPRYGWLQRFRWAWASGSCVVLVCKKAWPARSGSKLRPLKPCKMATIFPQLNMLLHAACPCSYWCRVVLSLAELLC